MYSNLRQLSGRKNILLSPFRKLLRTIIYWYLPKYYHSHKFKSHISLERDKMVIISLTSFPARIEKLWIVINSLLRQSLQPDKVILWLSKKQFSNLDEIPLSLKKLLGDHFEIVFVEQDFRSHKKYLYAFEQYPDDYVILVDDDIIYRNDLIEKLVLAADKYPNSIICNYGCEIVYNEMGELAPYSSWNNVGLDKGLMSHFFFGSGGGTLFTPRLLYKDVLNIQLALKLTPIADDIWLNAIIRLSKLSVYYLNLGEFVPMEEDGEALFDSNVVQNDIQLQVISKHYQKTLGVNVFSQSFKN